MGFPEEEMTYVAADCEVGWSGRYSRVMRIEIDVITGSRLLFSFTKFVTL